MRPEGLGFTHNLKGRTEMKRLVKRIGLLALTAVWPMLAQGQAGSEITGLTVTTDGNAVTLNWNHPTVVDDAAQEGATLDGGHYEVSRAQVDRKSWAGNYVKIGHELPHTATSFTDRSAEPGRGYEYTVSRRYGGPCYDGDPTRPECGGLSGIGRSTPIVTIGHWPPHLLRGTVRDSFQGAAVDLYWRPSTDPGYVRQYVLRRQAKHVWGRIALLPADAGYYWDRDIVPGERYFYAIRAEKANGEGKRSKGVTVKVFDDRPTKPTNLRFLGITKFMPDRNPRTYTAFFSIRWDPGFRPDADGHNKYVRQDVYIKKFDSGSWEKVQSDLAPDQNITFVSQSGARSGVQYFFRVKAVMADGKGRWSNKISVVVPIFDD